MGGWGERSGSDEGVPVIVLYYVSATGERLKVLGNIQNLLIRSYITGLWDPPSQVGVSGQWGRLHIDIYFQYGRTPVTHIVFGAWTPMTHILFSGLDPNDPYFPN